MTLLSKIVTTKFVTDMAHVWFAAFAVSTALWYAPPAIVVSLALALAAIKEFYIDKHFEDSQSFLDNLRDFVGYAAGTAVGWLTNEKVSDHVVDQLVTVVNTVIMPLCKSAAVSL